MTTDCSKDTAAGSVFLKTNAFNMENMEAIKQMANCLLISENRLLLGEYVNFIGMCDLVASRFMPEIYVRNHFETFAQPNPIRAAIFSLGNKM